MEYTINILGTDWLVVFQDEPLEGGRTLGVTKSDERKIFVTKSGVSEDLFNRTFIHELFHAHLFMSGLHELFDENTGEALCVMVEQFTKIFQIQQGVLVKVATPKKKSKKKK